jgi:hypothetical protein
MFRPIAPSGQRAADDDVFGLHGIEAGSLHRMADDVAAQRGPVGIVERAAIGPADPGARRGNDDRVSHRRALPSLMG